MISAPATVHDRGVMQAATEASALAPAAEIVAVAPDVAAAAETQSQAATQAMAFAANDKSSDEARVAAIAAAAIDAQAREAAMHLTPAPQPTPLMATTDANIESDDQHVATPTDSGLATPELAQQSTHVKTVATAAPPARRSSRASAPWPTRVPPSLRSAQVEEEGTFHLTLTITVRSSSPPPPPPPPLASPAHRHP